jgi:GDPmannose 4,6-dehydratase
MRKALITGITGQDGSYLAELLLKKGYEVHGIVRRIGAENNEARMSRIISILHKITIHHGDVTDYPTVWKLINAIKPDEVYHLAAQSQVGISFEDEFGTLKTNIDGTHYLLSAIKELAPQCKFYFAATSEMFGRVLATPQNEQTPFNPVSPYGISKVTGFYLTKMYRNAYGIFACSGILFNHESPRRGYEFVTRKITLAVARIKCGQQKELKLGNIDAVRDWGFAPDYVDVMWRMLQQPKADDYVIGTGESHTIKELLEIAFGCVSLDWKEFVKFDDAALLRPTDVATLLADSKKAREVLQWSPSISFKEMVEAMVKADLENAAQENANI